MTGNRLKTRGNLAYMCSLMQLINNLEKIMVKYPGGELSSFSIWDRQKARGGGHSMVKNTRGLAR